MNAGRALGKPYKGGDAYRNNIGVEDKNLRKEKGLEKENF